MKQILGKEPLGPLFYLYFSLPNLHFKILSFHQFVLFYSKDENLVIMYFTEAIFTSRILSIYLPTYLPPFAVIEIFCMESFFRYSYKPRKYLLKQ